MQRTPSSAIAELGDLEPGPSEISCGWRSPRRAGGDLELGRAAGVAHRGRRALWRAGVASPRSKESDGELRAVAVAV